MVLLTLSASLNRHVIRFKACHHLKEFLGNQPTMILALSGKSKALNTKVDFWRTCHLYCFIKSDGSKRLDAILANCSLTLRSTLTLLRREE